MHLDVIANEDKLGVPNGHNKENFSNKGSALPYPCLETLFRRESAEHLLKTTMLILIIAACFQSHRMVCDGKDLEDDPVPPPAMGRVSSH